MYMFACTKDSHMDMCACTEVSHMYMFACTKDSHMDMCACTEVSHMLMFACTEVSHVFCLLVLRLVTCSVCLY